MAGYILLHRSALEHPLLQEADRFRAWCWLIAFAAWRPTRFNIRGRIVMLERGQLCAGRDQLAAAWKWHSSSVERFLARLEAEGMIERQTEQGRSIISISNYDIYQDSAGLAEQLTEQAGHPDSQRTARRRKTGQRAGQPCGATSGEFEGEISPDASEAGQPIEQPANSSTSPNRTTKEGRKHTRTSPLERTRTRNDTSNRKSVGARKLPSDWQPETADEEMLSIIAEWPRDRLERELAQFRDHAADKGRRSTNWQAAFRKWLRDARSPEAKRGGGRGLFEASRDRGTVVDGWMSDE